MVENAKEETLAVQRPEPSVLPGENTPMGNESQLEPSLKKVNDEPLTGKKRVRSADLNESFEQALDPKRFKKPKPNPMMGPGSTDFYKDIEAAVKNHFADGEEELDQDDLAKVNQALQSAASKTNFKEKDRTHSEAALISGKIICNLKLDSQGALTARFDRGSGLTRKQRYLMWAKATLAIWLKQYKKPEDFPVLEMVDVKNEEDIKLVEETFGVYFAKLKINNVDYSRNDKKAAVSFTTQKKEEQKPEVSFTAQKKEETETRQTWRKPKLFRNNSERDLEKNLDEKTTKRPRSNSL